MGRIDELIQKYVNGSTGNEDADVFIKVKLKMIRSLFEEIKGSEDRIYMEEIIFKFAEIMDCQQGIIDAAKNCGTASVLHGFAAQRELKPEDIPWEPECEPVEDEPAKDIPSYLPPEDGFQSDEQVKKAFTNYLTYHVNRKTKAGKDKPFSVHTIYDYSSRIKVLMEIACDEWQAGNGYRWIQLSEQTLQAGCPFLNAYNNLPVLKQYIENKEQELRDISMGLREPAPDGQKNPLNNIRNLNNTSAALARFEEFRNSVMQSD